MSDFDHAIRIYKHTYRNHPIRVYEVDGGWHSAYYLEEHLHNELIFQYLIEALQAFTQMPHAKNSLLIGGGMYSFPRYILSHFDNVQMDVVEIDDSTLRCAKDYFGFDEFIQEDPIRADRLHIFIEDGRKFLENTSSRYDIIFNDAYDGTDPAPTLLTTEFITTLKTKLTDDGIYVMNLPGYQHLKKSKLLLNEIKTLEQHFQYVYLVSAKNELSGIKIINYIVFASDKAYSFENALPYSTKKATILSEE